MSTSDVAPKAIDKADILANKTLEAYFGRPLSDMKKCHSPLRSDSTPSFSVFAGKQGIQLARDHSTSETYNIIQLHMALNEVGFGQALRELHEWNGSTPLASIDVTTTSKPAHTSKSNPGGSGGGGNGSDRPTVDDIGQRTARPVSESMYLRGKRLEMPDWVQAGLDAYTDKIGNLCYVTACGRNYHLKGGKIANAKSGGTRTFTGWYSPYNKNENGGGYSICGNKSSKDIFIFEGIGDFLAFLALDPRKGPDSCYIILNSAGSAKMFAETLQGRFSAYATVNMLLDVDIAGDRASIIILQGCQDAGLRVKDWREWINSYGKKDVLDVYNHIRGEVHDCGYP